MNLDLDRVKQEIRFGKASCNVFSLLYMVLMLVVPSSWITMLCVLLLVTLMHLGFYLWCTSKNDVEVIQERYCNIEYVTVIAVLLLCAYIGESSTIFARGLSCCVVPIALLRNSRSRERAASYCVAHFCSVVFNLRSHSEPIEAIQWLSIVVMTYCVAFDMVLRNITLHESSAMIQSAYEVFGKMLATMCDGYLVLDAGGNILGMDQKASTIISPDIVARQEPFSSLLNLEAGAMYELRAGLEKLNLISSDGVCLELECYTCDYILDRASLPLVLGSGNHNFYKTRHQSKYGTPCGKYLRALRILHQTPLVEFSRPSVSTTSEPESSMPVTAVQQEVIATMQQHRRPSVSSEASSATASRKSSSTLGEKVDLMMRLLETNSRELLPSDKDRSKVVMSIKKDFKTFVKDIINQTAGQLRRMLEMSVSEAPGSGVIEEGEIEECEGV